MPNPLAYNSSTTPTGTFKRSNISYGLMPTNYGIGYGSLSWYNSLDTTSKYVIQQILVSDTYTLGFSTQGNAKPVMWSTGNTSNQNLINLINGMPGNTTNFTDYYEAVNWLQGTNKFLLLNNGYENIVTNGLVFNLDAAWWNSYPTSGTTWTDLSGNNYNGTLTNGPTFNSANNGYINFDGADDYFEVQQRAQLTEFQYYDSFSIELWVGNPINQYLFTNRKNTSLFFSGWAIYGQGSSIICWIGGYPDRYGWRRIYAPINAGGWNHIVYTNTSDYLSQKVYVNGVDVGYDITRDDGWADSIIDYTQQPYHVPVIGTSPADDYSQFGGGKIPIARVYNRTLTANEALQNYNAQKGRFGL
jgi:hypothetical protein